MSMLAVLLKESWAQVEDEADELANLFYARLFLADPGLRELFPVDMTAHRARLLETLRTVIQTIDDPENFDFIFEFGGGYGAMCEILHRAGFSGEYYIYDVPSMNKIQEHFLESSGIDGVVCTSNLDDIPTKSLQTNWF